MNTYFRKAQVAKEDASASLLLLFLGWGMDQYPFLSCLPEDTDVLICYNYRTLRFEPEIPNSYKRIKVVAWSMGVWAATQVLQQITVPISECIAVNGTPYPIDDTRGIPTDIFRATLEGLNEQTLQKFRRRMCGTGDRLKQFINNAPDRNIESLRTELSAIKTMATQTEPSPWHWDKAYIAKQDRIFTPIAQAEAWKETAIEYIEEYHLPDTSFWQQLFAYSNTH